jgi:DNA-binding transcriptional LysR family regulator
MKLSHIRDVLAVAEFGSLRAAGRHVGVAQPAITRSIREIEHELGAALFERHAKGVRLTAIGEAFTRRASIVNSELRRAREEVEQIKGRSTGQVRVGLSTATSIALLPAALEGFRKRFPDALVGVYETSFESVEQDIIRGNIDFYVGGVDPKSIVGSLSAEKLFDNTGLVIAREGHPLLGSKSLECLRAADWIRPALSDSCSEADFEGFFAGLGMSRPRVVMHTHSALQTLLAVASSDMLSAVPRQWLESPVLGNHVRALPHVGPISGPPVCIVSQTGVPLTPMAEYFCDMMRRRAGICCAAEKSVRPNDDKLVQLRNSRPKSSVGAKVGRSADFVENLGRAVPNAGQRLIYAAE